MGDGVFNNTLDHTLEGKFGKYHDCMLKRDEYQLRQHLRELLTPLKSVMWITETIEYI
jgi:hypothetical protein